MNRIQHATALLVCALPLTVGNALAAGLAGSEWRPVIVTQEDWPPDVDAFVRFEGEGRLAGHGGCNRFFGGYDIADQTLTRGHVGITKMACPEPAMGAENLLLDSLAKTRSFQRDGTELMLLDEAGDPIASFVQTDWD
ncbi:MAG: META domain-containing protein [Pseudomonadota bacterium]